MSDSVFINPAQHQQDEVLFDSGGTCDCYRLVKDNRVYCVKRPKPDMRSSEDYVCLFRKEFEMSVELEHPNIVHYFTYDEDEQGAFIRMEYIDGDRLEAFVAQHPDYFKNKHNRQLFLDELFSALSYLHDKGMLHLDLKPDNILITNKGHHVKLVDLGFGWSQGYLHDLGFTHDYCAPEQLAAKIEQIGPATDIYAVGKILQHYGLAQESVVQRCLKDNPAARFQSVGALQKAIKNTERFQTIYRIGLGLAAAMLIGAIIWLVGFREKPLPPRPPAPEGAIDGLFTINDAGDQVYFAQGNLQFQASTGTWRFAENQWSYVGKENDSISETNDGWIDLFCWGTSGYHDSIDPNNVNYQPWCDHDHIKGGAYNPSGMGPSANMASIDLTGSSANYDWGVFNPISNGGNQRGLWRTLSTEEWDYVLEKRNTLSGIRYAKAKLGPVCGLILFPDHWDANLYTPNSANVETSKYAENNIDFPQWDTLERAGAVFLPAAGSRWTNVAWALNFVGVYWTVTAAADTSAFRVYVDDTMIRNTPAAGRADGHAVRLVREAKGEN